MSGHLEVVTWAIAQPGVLAVTIERPPANALHPSILDGLHAAIDATEAIPGLRVVVVASGVDRFFAAGADIKHLGGVDSSAFLAYGDRIRAVNDRVAAAPWLSIAAVDGAALGGGLELALACTFRVGGPSATFGLPEVKLGLIPGAGGTQRLPRLVGRARALDLLVTGRAVDVAEAAAMGLVDRVAQDGALNGALRLADELSGPSLPAQLAAVRAVDASADLTLTDGLTREVALEQELFEHGEAAEGIAAFLAKRRPDFGGAR